jgi:hypothetical protein
MAAAGDAETWERMVVAALEAEDPHGSHQD